MGVAAAISRVLVGIKCVHAADWFLADPARDDPLLPGVEIDQTAPQVCVRKFTVQYQCVIQPVQGNVYTLNRRHGLKPLKAVGGIHG